jgi:proline-rich protein PRCC
MSLVADYGSDISSSEEENDIQNIKAETTVTTVTPETTKKTSLTSLLPPPKNKRNGPVKIVVDLPKPAKDDDDSDKDQISKKTKSSGSDLFALLPAPKRPITGKEQKSSANISTDLAANKPTTASTSFVPHTLTKRKSTAQKNSNLSQSISKIKGKEVKVHSDDDETKDKTESNIFRESFFPLGNWFCYC